MYEDQDKRGAGAVEQKRESTLPEEYAKVKHQRDKVVKAFNKLRDLNRQTSEDLLEIRTLVRELIEEREDKEARTRILVELQVLV